MTSPRSYPRADRVRAAIREVIAGELDRLRDPGLGFVTITDVTLTPDMRNAKAYYTVYGEEVVRASTRDALGRATAHLRTTVAHEIRLRYVPTLEFIEDPVPERTKHLDELLAKLHKEDE